MKERDGDIIISLAVSPFVGQMVISTLQAGISFLQTLPELVTPLKTGALFISAQLSTDAVSALRKMWVLDCESHSVEART